MHISRRMQQLINKINKKMKTKYIELELYEPGWDVTRWDTETDVRESWSLVNGFLKKREIMKLLREMAELSSEELLNYEAPDEDLDLGEDTTWRIQ